MHDDRIRRELDRQARYAERLAVEPKETDDGLGRRVMLEGEMAGRVRHTDGLPEYDDSPGWVVEYWNGEDDFESAPNVLADPHRRCDAEEIDRHAIGVVAEALADGLAKPRLAR